METVLPHNCTICNESETLLLRSTVEHIPYFGEHTQVTLMCDHCGWRQTDFIPAEGKKACRWSLKLNDKELMNARVVRSSSCTVQIPELELEVNPGGASTGYISNVEGVLNRFSEVLKILLNDSSKDIELAKSNNCDTEQFEIAISKCITMMEIIEETTKNGSHLTLTLLDPNGHSQIIHPKAASRELTPAEIKLLPIGPKPITFSL